MGEEKEKTSGKRRVYRLVLDLGNLHMATLSNRHVPCTFPLSVSVQNGRMGVLHRNHGNLHVWIMALACLQGVCGILHHGQGRT